MRGQFPAERIHAENVDQSTRDARCDKRSKVLLFARDTMPRPIRDIVVYSSRVRRLVGALRR